MKTVPLKFHTMWCWNARSKWKNLSPSMSGGRFLRIIGQTLVVSKSNRVRVADLSASLYRFEVYSNDSSFKQKLAVLMKSWTSTGYFSNATGFVCNYSSGRFSPPFVDLLFNDHIDSLSLMPRSHQTFRMVLAVKLPGLCWEIDVGPPLLALLQPEMLTDGARSGWCDQPLSGLNYWT